MRDRIIDAIVVLVAIAIIADAFSGRNTRQSNSEPEKITPDEIIYPDGRKVKYKPSNNPKQ